MANGFTAAFLSPTGLVRALGTTFPANISEVDTGILILANSNDLITRTRKLFPAGPTGEPWERDWWYAWNYLSYGAGSLLVGGTGAVWGLTMNAYEAGSPLETTTEPFNCVFSTDHGLGQVQGNISTAKMAAWVALQKQNIFAIIGVADNMRYYYNGKHTSVGGTDPNGFTYSQMLSFYGLQTNNATVRYNNYTNLQGITQGVIIAVGSRKQYLQSWSNAGFDYSGITTMNMASDYAGAMGRAVVNGYPWSIPAGLVRGRILNIVKLEHEFTPTQRANALADGSINMPEVISGKGVFFSSYATQANPNTPFGKVNFQAAINHIRSSIKEVALSYLFEPNTANTRDTFKTYAESVLSGMSLSGAIGYYNVECDATNQPDNKTLYARIILMPIDLIEVVSLQVSIAMYDPTTGQITVSTDPSNIYNL